MVLRTAITRLLILLQAAPIPYGGQAAIEGVMMKGDKHAALAMRRRDGSIELIDRQVTSRFPWLVKLPFVRGFFVLWDMLTLGLWALRESSHRYELDLEAEEAEKRGETPQQTSSNAAPISFAQTIMIGISLVIALLLFKVLPAAATTGVFTWLGFGPFREMVNVGFSHQLLANLIEGAIKLAIFIGYVWGVGQIADIARVFKYHGAEHIVINAYESDSERVQDISFIQTHTTAHPRCGTSFIVILVLLSVLLFTIMDWAIVSWWPQLVVDNIPVWYIRWPLRIIGLIPLAGISYEVVKAAFRYYHNPLLKPLLRFGMLFQALTTRKPTEAEIEVSLASFNRARYLSEGIMEPPLPSARAVASPNIA